MRREIAAALLASLAAVLVGGGPPDAGPARQEVVGPPPLMRIPDPDWEPRAGARAELHDAGIGSSAVPVAESLRIHRELFRAAEKMDTPTLASLLHEKRVTALPTGTEIEVREVIEQDDGDIVVARVLSGPAKYYTVYVSRAFVGRMIVRLRPPTPARLAIEEKARREAVEAELARKNRESDAMWRAHFADLAARRDDARAAGLLRLARVLDAEGKTAGALSYYRDVVKQAPKSVQADEARRRIKALAR